jgi:hypothetical protein
VQVIDLDTSLNMNLPAPITPRSTRAQRQFAHRAKMAGKVYDRERLAGQRTEIRTKAQLRRLVSLGSIAQLNRHTGKPHEHAREIARRENQEARDMNNREARGVVLAGGYRFVQTRRGLMQPVYSTQAAA